MWYRIISRACVSLTGVASTRHVTTLQITDSANHYITYTPLSHPLYEIHTRSSMHNERCIPRRGTVTCRECATVFIACAYRKTPPKFFSAWAQCAVNKFRDPEKAGIFAITAGLYDYRTAEALSVPLARNARFANTLLTLATIFSYRGNECRISDPHALTPMTILIHLLRSDNSIAVAVLKTMQAMIYDIPRAYVVATVERWQRIIDDANIAPTAFMVSFHEKRSMHAANLRRKTKMKPLSIDASVKLGNVIILQPPGRLRFAVDVRSVTAVR